LLPILFSTFCTVEVDSVSFFKLSPYLLRGMYVLWLKFRRKWRHADKITLWEAANLIQWVLENRPMAWLQLRILLADYLQSYREKQQAQHDAEDSNRLVCAAGSSCS
jgi:hypothetical protein